MGEYSKCKVDPSARGFVNRFKGLHPDFKKKPKIASITEENLFKFIVLTYDIHSPFVEKYKDWALRRRETAKVSGFVVIRGAYHKEVENIILGKIPEVNQLIVRYLFLQNDTDFIKFQSYQAMYFNQVKESMSSVTSMKPADFAKLKSNIDLLSSELKSLQKLIFSGNESKDLLTSLYDFVANITYDFKPEDVAAKKEAGEPVVDENPYGKYTPEILKFLDNE